MNTIVVTGGAGFIGSHLVEELVQRKDVEEVVVVDNLFLGRMENLAWARESGKLIEYLGKSGDCTDSATVYDILIEHCPDVIFNLAVLPLPHSLDHPHNNFMRNVKITANILDTFHVANGGSRLVHFSSSEVYGTCLEEPMTEKHWMNPTTPYAAAKAACDHLVTSYVKTFGVDAVILRPFNVIGPRQNAGSYAGVIPRTVARILHDEPPEIYGDGTNTRDYTYVSNVVEAALKVWIRGVHGEVYNVCRGRPCTINALVKMICDSIGYDYAQVVRRPDRWADVKSHIGSGTKLWELTGWGPTVHMKDAVEKTVDYYVNNYIDADKEE